MSEVPVATRSEREAEKRKKANKLRAVRIEPADGGWIVQKEMTDWESRPDPVVFSDEDDMFDYLSECFAGKHVEKEDPDYSGKVAAKDDEEVMEED